ncbi:hypothetical protein [Streptomyces sp. NPDC047108]|uniref:hypothetical protein n=1 Tax=Streptomyces sp. NPDC047108 TaxID=3155025 RepID=UPI00340CA1FE
MRRASLVSVATAAVLALSTQSALAYGEGDSVEGGADNQEVAAAVTHSQIKISHEGGGGTGKKGNLAPIGTNWKPPACWYEPLLTPKQLKRAVEEDKIDDVGIHESWSNGIFVDHYKEGEATENFDEANTTAPGYKNYNLGKDGYFWRSVAPDENEPKSWDCGRIMFWQDAGTIPDDEHAPTPEVLASYAYDKIRVPDTEVELNPEGKSTVNLPTWVWLDKGTFKDVKVRAELPNTGLWAETTAKPVSLNLDPGTEDAELHPASGECRINDDGSIGTPYTKGEGKETPPCGITYLRASDEPYKLNASVTWEISWEGSGGANGDLPDGTFETDQDMTVQEVQAINR